MLSTTDFEYQFKILYRPLSLYALRMVSNTDDSEDIVQQAFVDVWEKSLAGTVIDNLKAYLYRYIQKPFLSFLLFLHDTLRQPI